MYSYSLHSTHPVNTITRPNPTARRLNRHARHRHWCPTLLLAVLERASRQDAIRVLLLTCVIYVLIVSISLYLWFPFVARALTEIGLPVDAQALLDWFDGVQVKPVGAVRCHWRSAWPLDERRIREALKARAWRRLSARADLPNTSRVFDAMPSADLNASSCSPDSVLCEPAFEPLLWHNFSWRSSSSPPPKFASANRKSSRPVVDEGLELRTVLVLSAHLDTRDSSATNAASSSSSGGPLGQWLFPTRPGTRLRLVRAIAVVREPLPDEGLYCVQFVGDREVAVEPLRLKDAFHTIGTSSFIGMIFVFLWCGARFMPSYLGLTISYLYVQYIRLNQKMRAF